MQHSLPEPNTLPRPSGTAWSALRTTSPVCPWERPARLRLADQPVAMSPGEQEREPRVLCMDLYTGIRQPSTRNAGCLGWSSGVWVAFARALLVTGGLDGQ